MPPEYKLIFFNYFIKNLLISGKIDTFLPLPEEVCKTYHIKKKPQLWNDLTSTISHEKLLPIGLICFQIIETRSVRALLSRRNKSEVVKTKR